MIIFENEVIEARFTDEGYTIVEVLYSEGDKIRSFSFEYNDNSSHRKALEAEGWDRDKLIEDTAKYKKDSSSQLMQIVEGEVQHRVESILEKLQGEYVARDNFREEILNREMGKLKKEQALAPERFLKETLDMNNDVDSLFKLKLAIFTLDNVKDANNDIKKRLRKSKSVFECFAILHEIYVDQ